MKIFKKMDIVIIICLIGISFLPHLIFAININKNYDSIHAIVKVDGKVYKEISLSALKEDDTFTVETSNGNNTILVKDKSIHFICLQNLIQISENTSNRIRYFNQLINRFPTNISITELYLRLALEYEKESEWEMALKSYAMFLAQPDASTIQISGEPNAYKKARQLVGFSNSPKDWTFENLTDLETAMKRAIRNYDWRSLDKYKAKVNFFSMSWKQDEMDPNAQEEFSMKNFMRGNRVRFSA